MRSELRRITSKVIRSLRKWIALVFGGLAGYVVFILQIVRPSSLQLMLVEIIIPPVVAAFALFLYHALRRVYELSEDVRNNLVKIDELSTNLAEAADSMSLMEHKIHSIGGNILQKNVELRSKLDIDGSWHRDAHIEIEVTGDALSNLYHYNSIALSKGTFFRDYTISFKQLYSEANSKIRCDIQKRPTEALPNHIDINLTFSPPLSEGKRAVYEYYQSYKGTTAMTREEADKAKSARNIFRNEAVEIDGYRILCETEKIYRQIVFPYGYDISQPRIAVLYRGNRIDTEEERARRFFKASLVDNRWIFEWDLTESKLWHTYYFVWLPPPESEYRELVLRPNHT